MALLNLRQFLAVVEIRTKIVSVSSFTLGTLMAAARGPVDPPILLVMAAAVLSVDMATTAVNNFYDYLRQVDNAGFAREREKVLLYEGVAPGAALIVALLLYLLAAVLGVILAFLVGFELLLAGALCVGVGFLYTGGPRPISTTPLGELFAGGFLGSGLFLISFYAQTHNLSAEAFLASLPSLFLVASILTVNNTCDIEGDSAAGRRTLSILIGRRAARCLIYGLGVAAWIPAVLYVAEAGFERLLFAAAAFPAAWCYATMHRRGFRHETKQQSMASISVVFLCYTITAAACFSL